MQVKWISVIQRSGKEKMGTSIVLSEADRQMEADRFFFTEVRMDLTGNLSASLQKIRNVLERCGSVRISLNWMENTFS